MGMYITTCDGGNIRNVGLAIVNLLKIDGCHAAGRYTSLGKNDPQAQKVHSPNLLKRKRVSDYDVVGIGSVSFI